MIDWPVERPADEMATAPAMPTAMFFGLAAPMAAPIPSDLPGVNESIPSIHFGDGATSPDCGRLRKRRTAATSSTTPTTSWRVPAPLDGPDLDRSMALATTTRMPR